MLNPILPMIQHIWWAFQPPGDVILPVPPARRGGAGVMNWWWCLLNSRQLRV
jgi:hypothetical protein